MPPHEPETDSTTRTEATTQTDHASVQRERLLNGMIDAVTRESNGYSAATIAQVAANAGVTPPTFHEHFTDKADCFTAALQDTNRRILREIEQAVRDNDPATARASVICALVELAAREPANARLVMSEALAGGPQTLDARDDGITAVAAIIDDADQRAGPGLQTPDINSRVIVGAVHRLLAARLRRGENETPGLYQDILAWTRSYEQPAAEHRWSSLQPVTLGTTTNRSGAATMRPPPPAAPGSTRRARRSNERERILYATAQAAVADGYNATTIQQITTIAGVDERAFAEHFDDKRDAYLAVQELGFLRTMSATAGGYFHGGSWPERTWRAGRAFTQFFQANQAIAHIGFVDSYAIGGDSLKRIDDLVNAFTIFLQERQRFRRHGVRPSRLAVEAIAAAIFEIAYEQARRGRDTQIEGLLPHALYLTLAPFIGAEEANRFIEGQLTTAEDEAPPGRRHHGTP